MCHVIISKLLYIMYFLNVFYSTKNNMTHQFLNLTILTLQNTNYERKVAKRRNAHSGLNSPSPCTIRQLPNASVHSHRWEQKVEREEKGREKSAAYARAPIISPPNCSSAKGRLCFFRAADGADRGCDE